MSAVTIYNSDYDLWDAWLHKICGLGFFFLCTYLIGFIDESTQLDNWFMPAEENIQAGVAIRVEIGFFRVFPYENTALIPFELAVRRLNPVVAVKIRNAAVQAAIRKMYVMFFPIVGKGFSYGHRSPNDNSLHLDPNTRIQIIDSMNLLPQAEKDQCGAFIVSYNASIMLSS